MSIGLRCLVQGAVRMMPCESHGTIRTAHTTYAEALKTTTHPKTRCRKPYFATQYLMLLMMGVCTRNMSSYGYVNKIACCIKLAFQITSKSILHKNCYLLFMPFFCYNAIKLLQNDIGSSPDATYHILLL